ncbi:MAG: outer membrane beta-barrel protein [Muribaculaceae bacterium]|nr:outer membrane beta-barrel protein [Muribaculaceae bacterium]
MTHNRRIIPAAMMTAICVSAAWSATIKGVITDAEGEPMPGATVQLIAMPDTVSKGHTLADEGGDYTFSNVAPGRYVVLASMVSMADAHGEAEVKDDAQTLTLRPIVLKDDAIMLDEAVVTAIKAAVVAKQDTLEFNAGSFHTAPNATVNDLLKRLPGVEIGSDGSITSNGKSVTKILVDGKEFFGDDPQMATKNLPSNMVDKVQVVDRKSDLARLTGVDDGEEETVINLTVKKDMNNGWFGNVSAGYGTDSRYQGSFVVNNFSNGNQVTILGGLNNINENGFSDRGRGRFRDFGGNNGISTAQRLGVNFNVGKGEELRVGGDVLYSHSSRDARSKTATQYLFPDSVSYQDAHSNTTDRGHNINAGFRVQWKIDEYNTLDFRPEFSMNFRDASIESLSELMAGDAARSMVNSNTNRQENHGTSLQTSGQLIYNHNFAARPGRSMSVQGRYSFSDTRQKSLSWSNILYYLLQDNDEEYYRWVDSRSWSNSIDGRLTWTEPLGDPSRGNYLTAAYKIQYQWSNADKFTYDLPFPTDPLNFLLPDPTGVTGADGLFDASLSNSFRNRFFTQELQAGYKKVSRSLNLEAGMLFAPSSSLSDNLINPDANVPQRWVWNVSPYANVRWKIGERTSLRARYRARTSLPSMTQLQPVVDASDPLNIIEGNPDLKPTFTQTVNVMFSDYRAASQQALTAMVNVQYSMNSVVARTLTDRETGGRYTTYGNVNGNFNIFGMAMINRPIARSHWRFNANLNARYGSTPGYINGDYNRIGSLTLSPRAGVTFSSDIFQMTLNPSYSFSDVSNSLPQQPGRVTHAYGFDTDASLYLPFGLELTTDLSFSKTSGYAQGLNSSQWLWNAQLSYSFLADRQLTASVRAYDLLNMKKNISRSVSASTIIDSEYNDLTRYVMVSLTWNFSTLRKKQATAVQSPFGPEEGMPGPPPGDEEGRGRGHRGTGERQGPPGEGFGGRGGRGPR